MKLKHGLLLVFLISSILFVNAQPTQRTVEERVKTVHEKMDSAFKFDAEKQAKIDAIFTNYYKQQDKLRQEMMSGGERPDFQAMREKTQPLTDARDKELKPLLTDEQLKKWKEEIEPTLMPRRGGGGNR